MTREEFNKLINATFDPKWTCSICKHQTDEQCFTDCKKFEVSDKVWNKYNRGALKCM